MLKSVAVQFMEKLEVRKQYILDYVCNNQLYLYEEFNAQKIDPGSELQAMIKDIEQKNGGVVYAVTHDRLPIVGEMYSFLYVSPYQEDWDHILLPVDDRRFMVYAYVMNVENDTFSEFGYVVLESSLGNLIRVG